MPSHHLAKESPPRIDDILKRIPFFACLADEQYLDLKRVLARKIFRKNEMILLEDQTSDFMYIIYSGKVKVVKISRDGREKILAFHQGGDFFGEMALLDGRTAPATVIAMETTSVGLLRKDDFQRCVLANEKAVHAVISLLCSRLREAWLMLKVLSLADAEHKVRAVLCQMGRRYGEKGEQGTIFSMRLTHEDFAHYASVSRETVTRLLDKFSKAGEIKVLGRRTLLLKADFFNKIALL